MAHWTAVTFFSVYLISEVGLGPLQLALVGTALELPYFFLEVPTGIVADRYSRRLSVLIGLVLFGASFFGLAFAGTFWQVVIVQVFFAAGFAFASGADVAWLSDEVG